MRTAASEVVLLVGSLLILVAGIGVLRFRPALGRLHALTKASTLGVVLVLVGAAIASHRTNDWTSLLLAAALQLATSPISASLISRSTFLVGDQEAVADEA
ncbi:monovalent cation/H(+) antiporter subunit G [Dermatobacter hominis]|uniref:monovalent cation/H(+) antiporter subunit G n=1 Tax=Dermatobacter hominis TaxID=2884263 RepID=UPI001D11914F|nr:monovalent cation/H(+) antiporter subunit G [Dermatobacter hominis]UDY35258.1 monovalent cation/H(+) antiporter subunit G [Dermatobacter hominis]